MKIWYFHHYGSAPGYGKYLRPFYLAKEWRKYGHETIVFVAKFHHLLDKNENLPDNFIVDDVNFVSLKARKYIGNSVNRLLNMAQFCVSMLKLKKLDALSSPDVIIVSSPHPFAFFSARYLSRKHNAKLVFEVRDLWPLSIIEMSNISKWHPFALLAAYAERAAYRDADIVGSLLGNAEIYMRSKGLNAGKFVHVPNGVPPERTPVADRPESAAGKAAADQLLRWKDEGRLVIIHPGTQGYPSALDRLLRAMKVVNDAGCSDQYATLLIGDGDTGGELKRLAYELDIANVAFFPPVPRAEALYLTNCSDIGYAGKRNFQTVFQYGISFNKINDFFECGLPVILPVTTKGDPVSGSGAGVVTVSDSHEDIANAIICLLKAGKEDLNLMGIKGKAYVNDELSYERIAKNYLDKIGGS